MQFARVLSLATILGASLGAPAFAVTGEGAAAGPAYATAFTPQYGVGAFAGVMKLQVAPDGTISGEYRNEDQGIFTPVTGGVTRGQVHLDFNWLGPTHVEGTFDGTTIHGSTFKDGRVYIFSATPDAG